MLYNDEQVPEIQFDLNVQNEVESEVLPVERSQEGGQISGVSVEVKKEREYVQEKSDEVVERLIKENEIPEALCAAEAVNFQSGENPSFAAKYD